MNLDIYADKPAPRANSKPEAAPIKSTVKKPASPKQPQTMYDVAIKNG